MGNIIGHLLDVADNWPPNHVDKNHWCYEAGSNPNHHRHYCDDPDIGSPQYDSDFDYSVFRCREARCQTCLDLNAEFYPARELWTGTMKKKADHQSREIHVTAISLLESASGGCKLCSVLEEGIRLVGGSKVLEPSNVFCLELLKAFTVRVTHETPMKSASEEGERLIVEFHSSVDEITPLAWKAFGAAERVKREVGVTDCVQFIDASIKKCLNHPKCVQNHSSTSRPKLPTRCIDVGTGENDVRLETSLKAGEKYIALSHAWGALNLPKTTTGNLQQHCNNISWASLSRTFQDAILITRGLAIRYIWVDSLCIIQDSSSDWAAEAKDMKNVYANSYLTLAATSAAESSEGLLRPRYNLDENSNPEYVCDYEIKRSAHLSQHSLYARRAIKYSHKFLLSLEYKGGHKELAPLLYRAWVLQERILSPRTLHFSFDEMVWECNTGIDCECGFAASLSGRALSGSPLGSDIFKELFNNIKAANLQIPEEAQEELFSAWYRLVEYYMALSLTFPADRLPALRGITEFLEEKLGWTFLEGVWVEDIVPGLLWSRNWLRSFQRNETAPAWSWASMEPIDGSSWDKSSLSVPAVYDVLHFEKSTRAIHVHERFRLIAHSASPQQQQEEEDEDEEEGNSCQNIVPGDRAYIVVEAPFINATVVAEPTSPTENRAPSTETAYREDCNGELVREGELPEADDEKIKTEGESKALRLSVEGNKTLVRVTWDISSSTTIPPPPPLATRWTVMMK